MKVTLKCFGQYTCVNVRSSPFVEEDNIIDTIPNHMQFEVENAVYNENWLKLPEKEAYVMLWLRTNMGIVDYALNRGQLKMLPRKTYEKTLTKTFQNLTLNEDNIQKKEESETQIEDQPKKSRGGRVKKERIPATVRNIVWVTHFEGSKKGRCWLCKVEDISSANFECGHVVSEKNGGKPTIDNLKPICSFCNKSVGTMNMEDFKKKYNIP